MKYILIVLIVLAYGSAVSVIFQGGYEINNIIALILMTAISAYCSRRLYRVSKRNKSEWALFGFLGNISALIYHWLFVLYTENRKTGKKVTGNN